MAKKTFINRDNPAMNFISQASIDAVEGKKPAGSATPTGTEPVSQWYADPKYIEKKTQRVQLIMQPSVYKDAKEACGDLGISLNDYMSTLVKEATSNATVRELIAQRIAERKEER